MTPIWPTIVVAALTSVLALVGALGSQWLTANRADRRLALERDVRLADRNRQSREDAYAKFLTAARAFPAGDAALTSLEDAAAYIELHAPTIADGPMTATLDAARRLSTLLQGTPGTSPVVLEARTEYQTALRELRDRMRADLAHP
ncbi:hypothetical protein ACQPW3_25270 [Actinosynnema sp. CA-248983]